MARSMIRHAPNDSELGRRLAHLTDPAMLEVLYQAEPHLRSLAEGITFMSEPRLWKAPVRAVANYRLLAELDVRGRKKALEAFKREPEAMLFAAELLQDLEKAKAKSDERNRESQPDHRWLARYLIAAELLNVAADMPEASVTAVRREVGRRLGALREPVNTATIRRALHDFAIGQLVALPPIARAAVTTYLDLLSCYFQPGWQHRACEGADWPARNILMVYGKALEFWMGPTASLEMQQEAAIELELRLLSVELDRKSALGSTEPAAQTSA